MDNNYFRPSKFSDKDKPLMQESEVDFTLADITKPSLITVNGKEYKSCLSDEVFKGKKLSWRMRFGNWLFKKIFGL